MRTGLGVVAASVVAVLGVVLLALVGTAGTALACLTAPLPVLADDAPVPANARLWIAAVQDACPRLPQPWIAAVMSTDTQVGTRTPTDGTLGPIAIPAADQARIHAAAPAAPVDAVAASDGAGRILCSQLDDIAGDTTAAAVGLSPLDALALVHRAGDDALVAYPNIAAGDRAYVARVHDDAVAWSAEQSEDTASPLPASRGAAVSSACVGSVGAGGAVVIPPGTSTSVADAVANALDLVGSRTGWYRRCDRLACRAYGYANSGYESATVHWQRMLATGHAHPDDRCPPLGSFVYWATGSPEGHVALVVATDPTCDPTRIKLVTNDALDHATGFTGGVYLVTLAQIQNGFMNPSRYRGWSDPVCAGALVAGAS